MNIGYARFSTDEQNLYMQIDALEKAGCKKIYQEKDDKKAVEWYKKAANQGYADAQYNLHFFCIKRIA